LSATVIQVIQLVLNGGVLLAGAAVWGLYVKTLKANIEGANQHVSFWKDKAEALEQRSPEVIERILSKRLKIATKELERLEDEWDQTTKAQEDLKQEVAVLNRTLKTTRGFREMLAMERPSPEDPDYEEFLEYSKTQEDEQVDIEVVYMGSVGVDSGQLMITDPAYVDSEWQDEPYEDDRVYRDKHDGSLVTWGEDFIRYDEALEPYGKTPNELIESGRLVQLPPPPKPDTFNYSYNGACQATQAEGYGELTYRLGHTGAAVVFGSGWGDGYYPVFGEKHDGRIMRVYVNTGAAPIPDSD